MALMLSHYSLILGDVSVGGTPLSFNMFFVHELRIAVPDGYTFSCREGDAIFLFAKP